MNLRILTIAALLGIAGLSSYFLLFGTTTTTTLSLSEAPASGAVQQVEPPTGLQEGPIYHVGGVEVPPVFLILAAVVTALLLFVAGWMIVRAGKQPAWRCFVVTACLASLIGAYLCIYRLSIGGMFLLVVTAFLLAPLACGFGISWARSLEGRSTAWGAGLLVLVVSAAPVSMLVFPWPLHLAFFVSAPALERVADDALAEGTLEQPRWAGLFRIVDTAVEDGSVALIIDPDRAGRSGLVRVAAGPPREGYSGPMYNLNWDLSLDARWRYQNED